MKTILITKSYNPKLGGVERHVEGLSKELLKRGYDISIITEQHDTTLPLREVIDGITIYRIPYENISGKLGIWRWMLDHAPLFKSGDIVHAHDVFWWLTPLLHKLPKPKLFQTFHGYEPDKLPDWRRKLQRKLIVRATHKAMVVGAFIENWYGIRADEVSYGAQQPLSVRPVSVDSNSFIFVGRLAPDTGILEYIDFLSHLSPTPHFAIYGPGEAEYITLMKERAERMKLSYAYYGVTDSPERVMQKSHYVLSSQYLTMLMAMQLKKPILSIYNTPIKRDYLACHPRADGIVLGKNANELYYEFKQLSASARAQMIRDNYSWAVEQTFEKLATQYEQMWR